MRPTCKLSVQLHKLLNLNFYICVTKIYKILTALLKSWTSLQISGSGRVAEFEQFQNDPSCLKHNVKLMALNLLLYWLVPRGGGGIPDS